MKTHLIQRSAAAGLAVLAALVADAGAASEPGAQAFPALARSALEVKAAERCVLQAAALAGSRLVAAGERGVIALSDDGGAHWRQARFVPVSVTLTALHFLDARVGWAVGHGGVILRSDDGGEHWRRLADGPALARAAVDAARASLRQAPDDGPAQRQLKAAEALAANSHNSPLFDLYFADASHGYVVGAYGQFFVTDDGGQSWSSAMSRLDNPQGLHLYAMRARGKTIFLVGEQGLMLRSQDGGQRFQSLASPYAGSWFGLALTRDGVVAAGLRGHAFYSGDDGQSWARIAGAPPASFLAVAPLGDGRVLLANQAGQLFSSRFGAPLTAFPAPPLPPLAGALALPGGAVLAYGAGGALRLPALSTVSEKSRP